MIGWLYDLVARKAEAGEMGERRRELLAALEGEVLEIGAGTGANVRHYGRAARVVALEPDKSMARRLRPKLGDASVPVEPASGRAEALPFPAGSFDAVVSTFVLCSVAEPARVLAEIHRVLRPGGRLVLLEHVRGEGSLARWQRRLTPLHRKLAGNCHLDRDTRSAVAAGGFDVAGVQATRIPGSHPLVRAGIQGAAIKTSS